MNPSRSILVSTCPLLLLFCSQAQAHTQLGALGLSATATDIYQASCLDDGNGPPHHLTTQIMDMAPVAAPVITLTVSKDGKTKSTFDPRDGDSQYSPALTVEAGAGNYLLTVTKSAVGKESYMLQYHCITANNVHTGSTLIKKQDQ